MKKEITYKGLRVRVIPWWMKLLSPRTRYAKGAAFLGRIYLNKELFGRYCSGPVDPIIVGILEHEYVHFERAQKLGKYRFAFRMWTSRSFMFAEEIEARRGQMVIHKRFQIPFDIQYHAEKLSSWIYQRCTSYENAKKVLTEMWEEIQKQP